MCYKDEVQKKNAAKLQRKFEEENVPEFIQKYLINKRSKLGALNYWSAIRNLLLWLIDKKLINKNNISDITPDDMTYIESVDINQYLEEREREGISPTTLYTKKNIFSGFWEYMKTTKRIPVDANIIPGVAYIGMESNNNFFMKMPTQEDLDEMEDNIKKKHDKFVKERNLIVFTILKGTGLRECEVVELEYSSLFLNGTDDCEMPYIMVVGKGKYRIQEGRRVLLSGTVKTAFEDWLEIRNKIENVVDEKAIFLNKNGKRLSTDNIQSIFKTYSKGKLTCHQLRHWYSTITAREFGVVFAQQQLGHKNTNITINTYTDGSYGMKDVLASI